MAPIGTSLTAAQADARIAMQEAITDVKTAINRPKTPAGARCHCRAVTTMPEIRYSVQYCVGGTDITGDFYAAQDADCVRFWEAGGDPFCLLEVTRQVDDLGRPVWVATGSDATYTLFPDQPFLEPLDALRAQLPESSGYGLIEAEEQP